MCTGSCTHTWEHKYTHAPDSTYKHICREIEKSSSPLEEEELLQLYRNVRKGERASGAMKDDIEV